MKKVFMLFALMMAFVTFASAQRTEISLSASDKRELMGEIELPIENLILNFNGRFSGARIDHVYRISNSEVLVTGIVDYHTKKCGDVSTDFRVVITKDNSGIYAKPNIYTPYCIRVRQKHIVTKHEWDDVGKSSQIKLRDVAEFAANIILNRIFN